ncbi:SwmB domain-containing protein, partial [Acinetobacter silvestris]
SITVDGKLVVPNSVTVSGTDVTLSFVPPIGIDQAVTFKYSDPSAANDTDAIQDTAGNDAASIPETSLAPSDNHSTIDSTAPVFQNAEVDDAGTTLTLYYDEVLDGTHPPKLSDFSITVGGLIVTPTTIYIDSNKVIIGFTDTIYKGQNVRVSYTDPTIGNDTDAIQDALGNDAESLTQAPVLNGSTQPSPDTTAPIFQSAEVNSNGQLLLHYNEALDGANKPLTDAFTIIVNGQDVVPSLVTISGSDVILSFVPPIGKGQGVIFAYTDPSSDNDVNAIQDIAGNDAANIPVTNLPPADNHSTIDSTAPVFQSAEVDSTGHLVLHYNENLDGSHPPKVSDFSITVDGKLVVPNSVTVSGTDVTLSFVPPIGIDQAVTFKYSDPSAANDTDAIQDIAGNDAASIPETSLAPSDNHSTIDSTAPVFQSAEVDTTGHLVLHYNENLDGSHPPKVSDFSITVDGKLVVPNSVSVSGTDVTLSFVPPIGIDQAVTFKYSDPSAANDTDAIQDTAGNDAASIPVTNLPPADNHSTIDSTAPVFQSAEVDSTGHLVLHYNENLDGSHPPKVSDFSITVDG